MNKKQNIINIESITNNKIIHTMEDADYITKKINAKIMIIAPTSGNTIAKLSNSISDTPVTLAAKNLLRNKKPLVLSINASDGLGANASNIGVLLNRKNVFFVPFRQTNPITKPDFICSDSSLIIKTSILALKNEQIQPLLT